MRTFISILLLSHAALSHVNLSPHLDELNIEGFTVIPDLLSSSQLSVIQNLFMQASERASEIFSNTPTQERVFYENNQEVRSRFWKTDKELILQAGHGRYDLYRGFMTGVPEIPELQNLMFELMKGDHSCYSGFIDSKPGSQAQYWHRDTGTLQNNASDGTQMVTLDDFYFTVLIPITVGFNFENGATEFRTGSHRVPSTQFGTQTQRKEVPLRSILVFNGKIDHRGRENNSEESRPALYIVCHKKWYNDQWRKGVEENR